MDANRVLLMETRYKPFGEVRYATTGQTLPTRYTFTGQYSYVSDEATDAAGFGLMYFNARWMDPWLGRFAQADTIIPNPSDSQAWDRYAYANNDPVRYSDPSGHRICEGFNANSCISVKESITLVNQGKEKLAGNIEQQYRSVRIQDLAQWTIRQLTSILNALNAIDMRFNHNQDAFYRAFGNVTFVPVASGALGVGNIADANYETGVIRVTPGAIMSETFLHEMGHIFDGHDHALRGSECYLKSQIFVSSFNSGTCTISPCYADSGWDPTGKTTDYARKSSLEDFADPFATVMGADYGVSPTRIELINLGISRYVGPADWFHQ